MSGHALPPTMLRPRGTRLTADEKNAVYAELLAGLEAVLAPPGEAPIADPVAVMATTCSLLHQALPYASWTGFYRVVSPGLLRVGPYQGPLGCLEIPFERGVCGAAAGRREVVIVDDVHAFPGHIACDAAARSEIVVPWVGGDGSLIAVLDLDSHLPAAFDGTDGRWLVTILDRLARLVAGVPIVTPLGVASY